MIKSIIAILNKLAANIEKYSVKLNSNKDCIDISFEIDNSKYYIYTMRDQFYFYTNGTGTKIEVPLDGPEKYEVKKLMEIIKVTCYEYTENKIKEIANLPSDDEID